MTSSHFESPPKRLSKSFPKKSTFLRSSLLLSSLFLTNLASVKGQALAEPPNGQVMFGMWYDSQAGFSDNPFWVNQRLGFNVPVFQLSQVIPVPPYDYVKGSGGPALENMIELSGTDAAVYLTVYPVNGMDSYTTQDLTDLGNQLLVYQTNYNRTVFLRFAPEMQGTWNLYGNQPTAFLAGWKTMYTTIKSIAPKTVIIWGPNTGQGYPYGQTFPTGPNAAADKALLDTNNNNQFDAGDDPYSPYWPGVDFVDWMGLSIYYKGITDQLTNAVQPTGYCDNVFNGVNPTGATGGTAATFSNFYATYCQPYTNKACMMTESGAAYHLNDSQSAVTQLQIATAWINDCITNATFLNKNPRIKMITNFEYIKSEEYNNLQDLRDYRLTNQSAILSVLQQGFSTIGSTYTWANPRSIPTVISKPGEAGPSIISTNSLGQPVSTSISTAPAIITETFRTRSTQAPSLFGNKFKSGGLKDFVMEWGGLGLMVGAGVMGMGGVWRWL